MDEECWALYINNDVDIAKPLLEQQVDHGASSFLQENFFYWHKRAHQK
jgi:hypothetical protein